MNWNIGQVIHITHYVLEAVIHRLVNSHINPKASSGEDRRYIVPRMMLPLTCYRYSGVEHVICSRVQRHIAPAVVKIPSMSFGTNSV